LLNPRSCATKPPGSNPCWWKPGGHVNDDQPFGKKAKAWMAEKLSKGGEVLWSMKKGIAEGLVVEAMTQFYGWMA
jgi:hypothetical protein